MPLLFSYGTLQQESAYAQVSHGSLAYRIPAWSWTLTAGGWYRTLLDDPLCTIQIGERQVRVRAVRPRGTAILDAIEDAYAAKYTTAASRKYVRGFRTPRRRAATMEFQPRS